MSRYVKYQEAVRQEQDFRQEQQKLHEQYENVEEDTVIIETPNTVKYLLLYLRLLGKTIFGATVILFTSAGIMTLLYPDSRQAFLVVLQQVIENIKVLL